MARSEKELCKSFLLTSMGWDGLPYVGARLVERLNFYTGNKIKHTLSIKRNMNRFPFQPVLISRIIAIFFPFHPGDPEVWVIRPEAHDVRRRAHEFPIPQWCQGSPVERNDFLKAGGGHAKAQMGETHGEPSFD